LKKIKAGHLTLRQFDEILNERKKDKSEVGLKNLGSKYNIDPAVLSVLVHFYKPFNRIVQKSNDDSSVKEAKLNSPEISVFPNLIADDSNKTEGTKSS
jgi:hypothetical protein